MNMLTRKTSLALILSACWIVPASADTTQERIREAARVHDTIIASQSGKTMVAGMVMPTQFELLEGETVLGAKGQKLATIIAVDHDAALAQFHMYDMGKSVAVPTALLGLDNGRVMASTMSRADLVAMTRTQSQGRQYDNRLLSLAEPKPAQQQQLSLSRSELDDQYTYQLALLE